MTTRIPTRLVGSVAAGACMLAAMIGATVTSAQAQAPKLWRHGILSPKADAGFMEMAARRGFAEREGLKLELVEFKDDPIGLKALLSGEIDSYEGGVQGPIAADVRGGDIKIIGCYWPIVPHGLMVKNTVNSVEELKGKSIAVSSPGSFPDMLVRVALAKYNFKASDMKLAAVVSNEYLPLPTSKNLKMLLTGKDAGPNFLRVCMYSTGKTLADRREDAIRYLTAQSKALRYALSHRDETIKLTMEVTSAKADDPRPAFVYDDAVKSGSIAPELPLPMDKLNWMQDQLVELGQIPKAGDMTKMVNTEIRKIAVERAEK